MNNISKVMICIMVAVLITTTSIGAFVFSTGVNNTIETKNRDMLTNNEEKEATTLEDTNENVMTTQELEIKKVNPDTIFEDLGISTDYEVFARNIEKYLSDEPLTVEQSDYQDPMDMVIPSNKAFYSTASEPSSSESEVVAGSRAGRSDAGNDAAHATHLKEGGNWTGDDLYCTYDTNNQRYTIQDQDWFYIYVEEKGNLQTEFVEIYINNSAKPHAVDPRQLRCFLYDPISIILASCSDPGTNMPYPIQGDNYGKSVRFDNTENDLVISYLDYAIFTPQENGTLRASPPISGVFLVQLYCLSRGYYLPYNITAVKKTIIKPVSAPYDKNNYPENATIPLTQDPITGSLLQHKDHWDWFDISGFIEPHGETWPNEIDYTLDITRQATQANTYYSWTEIWVMYYSTDGNTLYLNGDIIDSGGSPSVNVGGIPSVPIKNKFDITGERAWFGLRTFSVGIDQNGQLFLHRYDGSVDYKLTFKVELQNNQPLLYQGKIDPDQDYYFTHEDISFYIKYRDIDSNPPLYVRVTIDGVNYPMTGTGSNYPIGVEYKFTIKGSDLDNNIYPHTFNFSASDGLIPVSMSLSSPNNQFKVIEDQTPDIWPDAPKNIKLDEDDDDYPLPLNQIFIDKDPIDGLIYSIKKINTYSSKYESERLEVLITQNTKLTFRLKDNQWGNDEFVVRAEESLKREADVYKFYASYKLNVTISSVEDAPTLAPIDKVHAFQGDQIYFPIQGLDPDIITDDDYLTFSTNRSDGKGPDDLEGFKVIHDPIDKTKANISFQPGNEHVGRFLVKVTVRDKDGLEDSRDVEFEIVNVNDAPVISQVKEGDLIIDTKSVSKVEMLATEDKWFNISVIVEDIDILIGEKNDIVFKIENQTFENNVELHHAGGTSLIANLAVLTLNEDVGNNYINLSVHDDKGASDSISIKVIVENVNDPPRNIEIIKPVEFIWSLVDVVLFQGSADDDDFYIVNSKENLTYRWYIYDGQWIDLEHYEKTFRVQFPTPYLPYNDNELKPGNYTFRFEVEDLDGEIGYDEISLRLLEDYDNDNIPDSWEFKHGLNHRDRADAVLDFDRDGFSNIDEYEARTDPTDSSSKPSEKQDTVDNTWIYIIVLVIVIVVLVVLFMVLRVRKKEKQALEDIDSMIYPEEEVAPTATAPLQPKPGIPMQPSPPGPGYPGAGRGAATMTMPPLPPPPPGISPIEFHMQYMKMVQQLQQQKTGQAPSPSKTLGLPPTADGELSLRPKLPPGKEIGSNIGMGMDSAPNQGTESALKNDMKCPNCGISVQSGWFLCPGCKSPLN